MDASKSERTTPAPEIADTQVKITSAIHIVQTAKREQAAAATVILVDSQLQHTRLAECVCVRESVCVCVLVHFTIAEIMFEAPADFFRPI